MTRIMTDALVVGGMLLLITFACLSTYSVIVLHAPFTPGDFGMGAGSILGAIGGGQGVRDWLIGKGASYVSAPKPVIP